MFKKTIISVIFLSLILIINALRLPAQSEDSLLIEKVKNLDISLNSLEETEEDLYLNPVSFQTFYDELSPVGEWIQITKEEIEKELKDGDGQSYPSYLQNDDEIVFIWKPKVDEEDWKPYTNGKWVYTDQGWLWLSNYEWGWAVHHYGRWWKSKIYGWVWMPGYVWAPAWVIWRVSDSHIGWCPLSPNAKWRGSEGITATDYTIRNKDADWVFVEKTKFVNEINRTVVVSPKQNKNIIPLSDRVLDIRLDNGRVINYGPDVADIEKKTGKRIEMKKIVVKKERTKALVGERDVSLYRTDFKRLDIDKATGKFKRIDKPRKFKKSPKIKKFIKHKKIKEKKRWKKTGGSILEPVYL